jgi:arylsulfatase A-like enzyme
MKVLVVVLRGLPLGYIGCYGNGWIDTPALDRLAAEGVVFDQHIADCPDAAAAGCAWRSGRYPFAFDEEIGAASDLVTLLREKGVITSLVVDSSRDTPSTFTNGWNSVRHIRTHAGDSSLERVLQAVSDVLYEVNESEQWLLWVELATLLPPWDLPADYTQKYLQPAAPEEEDEAEDQAEETLEPLTDPQPGPLGEPEDTKFLRLQGTLAGAVSCVDAGFSMLLNELDERGLAKDMMLIVTTDHGQALGEHGTVGPYRPWLHDELIHLPLLVRLRGCAEAGRRVAALTQPVDLYPTLVEAFGCTAPLSHGQSLVALLDGCISQQRPCAVSALRADPREEWALRTPEWAFLLPIAAAPNDPPRLPQLYVKLQDRWEVNNVIQHHLETAEDLEKTLRAFMAATRQPGPFQIPSPEGVRG